MNKNIVTVGAAIVVAVATAAGIWAGSVTVVVSGVMVALAALAAASMVAHIAGRPLPVGRSAQLWAQRACAAALAGGAVFDLARGVWVALGGLALGAVGWLIAKATIDQARAALSMPDPAVVGRMRAMSEIAVETAALAGGLPLVRTNKGQLVLVGQVRGDTWRDSRELVDFTTQLAKVRRAQPDVEGLVVVADGLVGGGVQPVDGAVAVNACSSNHLRRALVR